MSWTSALIEHFPYAGLFMLLILGGIGFPFPEDTTLILCGFLISHAAVSAVPALIAVYSGVLSADLAIFLAGRKYGRKVVTHKRFSRVLTPRRLSAIEDKFRKRGVLVILIGRHLVGLRSQIILAAGAVGMSSIKFFVADAVSSLFTIAVMVGAGYMGGNSLQVIKKDMTRIEHIAVLLLLAMLVGCLFFRYFRSGTKV